MIPAPALKTLIAHPSAGPAGPDGLREVDLVITTYGYLLRAEWIAQAAWRLVVLDEAQAIKNPHAKQTRAVKNLQAGSENGADRHAGRVGWGYDPCSTSSTPAFYQDRLRTSTKFTKRLAEGPQAAGPLHELIEKPYPAASEDG